jgi:uncharacterized membrane-anchored protein
VKEQHLPRLGPRFWAGLCLASIFGANMGDFFAHDIGLGHIAGLPFLAVGFALILLAERVDTGFRELYYWLAIVVVRTAATNIADYLAGDLKLPRPWVMAGIAVALVLAILFIWSRRRAAGIVDSRLTLLTADTPYWIGMLLAGTLGTVIGDYVSHNLHLGDGLAALALGVPLALLFVVGRQGLLWSLPFYWLTIVVVRAAGTSAGDLLAGRGMLGLPLGTMVSGLAFVALLALWKDRRRGR